MIIGHFFLGIFNDPSKDLNRFLVNLYFVEEAVSVENMINSRSKLLLFSLVEDNNVGNKMRLVVNILFTKSYNFTFLFSNKK